MKEQFILAIDQGTTSSRAMIVDQTGQIRAQSQEEFKQYFPQSGWVEHDAIEIWRSVQSVMADVMIMGDFLPQDIAAIGITNQRETTVIWDRESGEPICHAIVWQSRQTQAIADDLIDAGYQDGIQKKTGLLIDSYYSATKIRWILDQVEGAQERAEKGELMFGTIDSWLLYKLTDGQVHATDYSNAARTMLFNIHDLEWDQEILDLLHIPSAILPEVRSNSEIYGYTAERRFFGHRIPISGMAGDQQSALFGQLCFRAGMTKNTYGTGSFVVMNLGNQAPISKHRLATTIAYVIDDQVHYALEGSVFVTGSAVQWLRDGLKLLKRSADSEAMAKKSQHADDLYIVPAFTGLAAPYWESNARGAIYGINRSTSDADFAQAVLRAMAYQSQDVLETMSQDTDLEIEELHVDGGASENNYLMQFQADLSQSKIVRAKNVETTALGAAYLAGLAVGFWKDLDQLQSLTEEGDIFQAKMPKAQAERLHAGWKKAIQATIYYAKESE